MPMRIMRRKHLLTRVQPKSAFILRFSFGLAWAKTSTRNVTTRLVNNNLNLTAINKSYLVDELARVGRGVISSEEDEQAGLLALFPPPSFGQGDDAAVLIAGHSDTLKLRVGIGKRNVLQHAGVLGHQTPVVLSRDGREVVDVAPVVVEDAQPRVLKVEGQLGVIVLITPELHARRRLDDGLRGAAQKHVHFLAVPGAELLARHHALNVPAVPEEDAAFDGAEHDAAVDAVVDGDRSRVVEHVDVAVLAVLDDELLTVQFPGQTAHGGVLQTAQREVFRINLQDESQIQSAVLVFGLNATCVLNTVSLSVSARDEGEECECFLNRAGFQRYFGTTWDKLIQSEQGLGSGRSDCGASESGPMPALKRRRAFSV